EALWLENRIVAVALVATRRPDEMALDLAAEIVRIAIRPGEAKHRDEAATTTFVRRCACLAQAVLGLPHRHREIPAGTVWLLGPIGGVDARLAVQRVDAQSRIVRECREAGGGGRRERL